MKTNFFVLKAGFIFFSCFWFLISCSKINDATTLGGELIPVVDNINTFDTVLQVEAFNGIFEIQDDSTRSSVGLTQYVGNITNDPLFGKTTATLFTGYSPAFFPFRFPVDKNLLTLDSVVLVLNYRETYGDTTVPHTVNVYEIEPTNIFRADTNYLIRQRPFTSRGPLVGSRSNVLPSTLNDSVFLFKEKAANQLRVRLNNTYGNRLLQLDTVKYNSDSAFKTAFKGFEVEAIGGNSIIGINLLDTNTKVALYYRYNKNGTDTSIVSYFRPHSATPTANHIERDYTGSQLETYQGGSTPDDLVFLQNTPGTFARLNIPGLSQLSNRIVHRAELIIEQVYHPSDNIFTKPSAIYLDGFDATDNRYETIPFDVQYDGASGQINGGSVGFGGKLTTDGMGNPITVWKINLSRYVQNVVTGVTTPRQLRLTSPYFLYNYTNILGVEREVPIIINQQYAKGRVRVGGGNHATQKMRLRIIYSKI